MNHPNFVTENILSTLICAAELNSEISFLFLRTLDSLVVTSNTESISEILVNRSVNESVEEEVILDPQSDWTECWESEEELSKPSRFIWSSRTRVFLKRCINFITERFDRFNGGLTETTGVCKNISKLTPATSLALLNTDNSAHQGWREWSLSYNLVRLYPLSNLEVLQPLLTGFCQTHCGDQRHSMNKKILYSTPVLWNIS